MLPYQGTYFLEITTAWETTRIGQSSGCQLKQSKRLIPKHPIYGHLVYFCGSSWRRPNNHFPTLIHLKWNHIWMRVIACISQWIVPTNYTLFWQPVGERGRMKEQVFNLFIQHSNLYKNNYNSLFKDNYQYLRYEDIYIIIFMISRIRNWINMISYCNNLHYIELIR